MEEFYTEIKQLIINTLDLEDISPEEIDTNAPLFGDGGLGLDSVDALELGMAVQKTYKFKIDSENVSMRESFENVATLADFISKNRGDK
ncbi:MAG: acyl carrier protein [Cardiobacteriaceae bacterium]|nr:acyl carrier protein [Cardiobacteriaceae bacterium]